MAKSSSIYICQQCGFKSLQFLGRCPECDSWGSLVESIEENRVGTGNKSKLKELPKIISLADVEEQNYKRLGSGFDEFDRVLGGGIVLGSVVLVSGDPGIGKSTLLTQLAINIDLARGPVASVSQVRPRPSASSGLAVDARDLSSAPPLTASVLYVAGEESAQQIKIRVERINPKSNMAILNEVDVDLINNAIEQQKPSLVIVDSIQTLETQDLNSVAGSVSQVRECAHRLHQVAKKLHIPIFIVGHVTKEGTVAGPRTLEHLVDVVLSLEGEPTSNFRVLRSSKNRFGPTDEVGIFEMEERGMIEVKNPSKLFLEQKVDAPGSAVAITMNGFRPLLVEIQALVTKSYAPIPRRMGSGIDNNRLQLLVAVLSKRLGLPLYDQDIFVNVTGGLRIFEPAADLAICMAIISSFKDQQIVSKTAFVGEVGLLGELRIVRQLDKRVAEAKKLGFINIISPSSVKSISEAVRALTK